MGQKRKWHCLVTWLQPGCGVQMRKAVRLGSEGMERGEGEGAALGLCETFMPTLGYVSCPHPLQEAASSEQGQVCFP